MTCKLATLFGEGSGKCDHLPTPLQTHGTSATPRVHKSPSMPCRSHRIQMKGRHNDWRTLPGAKPYAMLITQTIHHVLAFAGSAHRQLHSICTCHMHLQMHYNNHVTHRVSNQTEGELVDQHCKSSPDAAAVCPLKQGGTVLCVYAPTRTAVPFQRPNICRQL
jgi:hypothetical protein